MRQANPLEPERGFQRLSLVWTDDPGIQALNREWFGRDRVTDVISFAYPPFPGDPDAGWEGELVVNLHQAWEEGRLREGPDHELALYLAHGCDHLFGAEDDTPEGKHAMLERETAWVEAAARQGLIPSLFQPAPAPGNPA